MASYQPSQEILRKYAQVLVNFALNSGVGVKPGEVVECQIPDVAKPLALELQNVVLEAGAHPMIKLLPTEFDRAFYNLANDDQLTFFPEAYLRARLELVDHQIYMIADVDPFELTGVEPGKIIKARDSKKPFRDWRNAKELAGRFTWTVGLWGVESKAKMVGLTLKEYWQQIIQACYLDDPDPVTRWRELAAAQEEIRAKLNQLQIEWVRVEGEDVDLKLKLGANRAWMGGSGRNIPSFELFTTPDWRGTEGWIAFNQPLYRYGHVIQGIKLQFKDGLVTDAVASQGQEFLLEMLKSPNANKLGEFSLTDRKFSRITHPMAETLFDENIGGRFGNTHVAIGMAYRDCYQGGDAQKLTDQDWENLGYNDSGEHTDMVSTTDRTVTATLQDGSTKIIYQDGEFVL